jgi:hypothetical protein
MAFLKNPQNLLPEANLEIRLKNSLFFEIFSPALTNSRKSAPPLSPGCKDRPGFAAVSDAQTLPSTGAKAYPVYTAKTPRSS